MPSHKELVRRWVDVVNRRDLDAGALIAADAYIEHAIAPFGYAAPGSVNGPQHLRETAESLLAQYPDLQMTIEALVTEDDMIAVRVRSSGTNLGLLNDALPPTGKTFTAGQSHWFRVERGKLVEHWATRDDLGTMLQLGVVPRPGEPRP